MSSSAACRERGAIVLRAPIDSSLGVRENDEIEDLSRQDRDCLARRFPLAADVTLDTLETSLVFTEL
jgi:hypothetical protein